MQSQLHAGNVMRRLFPFLEWAVLLDRNSAFADIWAGVTAGVLILPQAIALATLAELPPEIGIYTAIFPVIICALFGSSWHVLSGPNTSISVMIATVIGAYATQGTPDFVMYAITLTFMVGAIQILFGLLRLGVVFNYFSHTVMMALVIGVGIIIVIQQLGDFFGLMVNSGEPVEDTLYSVTSRLGEANWYAALLGVITVLTGLYIKRKNRRYPFIIIATLTGLAGLWLIEFLFGSNTNIDKLGYLSLSSLPLSVPDFSPTNFYEAAEGLMIGAVIVAFLGLMQSAVIARAIGVKSGQIVNLNQEIVGQGLSNMGGSFLSCYPSCGSFNRSAANFDAGGRTPLAGIVSAIVLAGMVVLGAPLIAQLPIAVVAGVLILVGLGLIDVTYIKSVLSVRGESRIVFLLTVCTSVYSGLEWGVFLGIFLSIVIYLRHVSKPEAAIVSSDEARQYLPAGVDENNAIVLHLSGSLFFGSTANVERTFTDIAAGDKRKNVLVIAGEYIDNLDDAAANMIQSESQKRRVAGGDLYIWFRNDAMDKDIASTQLARKLGIDHVLYVITHD
jgi:SulP family sulfate permease